MSIVVGVPKEVKAKEDRVACTPGGVRMLVEQGHAVLVEAGAGVASGFDDLAYTNAGAEVVNSADTVFEQAELIVKVKEPLAEEFHRFREGQMLFAFLHLAANPRVAEMLQAKQIVAFAYENVEQGQRLPLLEPMSEIAGRMSVVVGSYYLSSPAGGKGVLIGGVPGVAPARVLIIGGGTAGINAARMAQGLGAEVTLLDINVERLRGIDLNLQSTVRTVYSNQQNLEALLPETDLLIGAVLVPGARAPKLVDRALLRRMQPGSVFVDIAIDQGGCAETSRPTTHDDPVYVEEGVIHYCVTNMPGSYARTATLALTNITLPYILQLADCGHKGGCDRCPGLASGLNTREGKIVHPAVASALL